MKKLLSEAIAFAAKHHHGQFDRGGNPYIMHAMEVMRLTGSDIEAVQCASVLHDVIEDTKATYAELREIGMTEEIIAAVVALTKVPGQTMGEYKENIFENRMAMIVKMADLTHNSDIRRLKSVREKDLQRVVEYQKFYQELKGRL